MILIRILNNKFVLLAYLISYLSLLVSYGQSASNRINISSITPSIDTGQNYAPWLNDDLTDLVQDQWAAKNFQYVDVTLKLINRTAITQVALYDYQGVFTDNPASIYALNGNTKTLIGVFTGELYLQWVNLDPTFPVTADAIVIHKYANNIPVKIKVFGQTVNNSTAQLQSIINFSPIGSKILGTAPFALTATSNNSGSSVTYTSSNPTIVAVSNVRGTWLATLVGPGTATITAAQAGTTTYTAAASVGQLVTVQVQSIINFSAITSKILGTSPFSLLAASNNSEASITYSSSNTGVVSVSNANGIWQATVVGGGNAIIQASQNGSGYYLAATAVTQPVNVQVQSIISFPAIATKAVGTAPFILAATSNNNATAITYTSSNPAVVAVANVTGTWQAVGVGVGTAIITASQSGNATYLTANSITQPVVVQATPILSMGKIPLDATRWYQPINSPDGIAALFDGITDVDIPIGYGKALSKVDAYYPLQPGETFNIERIRFFDGWGSNADAPMTLSIITDTWQWIPIASFTGVNYGWVGPYSDRPTTFNLDNAVKNARYLVLTSTRAYPTEIEFYGSYTSPTISAPKATLAPPVNREPVKLNNMLGVNAFEWDLEDAANPAVVEATRLAAVKNFTAIRHYLDWEKLESIPGSYTFNPSFSGSWNYDAMYERLKKEGIEVLACLKTQPGWMIATYPIADRDAENIPVAYGRNLTDPASYTEQAKVAFQFAARYGSNSIVPRNLLSVSTAPPRWTNDLVNQVKVGLNLIKYIECDNERDKWWKGRKAYQTAAEYATNLSAFYDGHKNTLGPGVGVKNADPTMQVVMGGLAAPTPDYVKAMVDWCRQYRGYRADGSVNLCWDIINYHYYSNDVSSSQSGNATRGMAPEVSAAGQTAKNFVAMAHQYACDMPVWITEAGYDLNQGSPLKAVAVGNRSVLETQADWTLRTALAYARWGVSRVFMYQLYDDNPTSPVQFGSMGLTNADHTPRPAAQFLSQFQQLIGGYTYAETLSTDPAVDRYELNGQSAYALVVPDERGRTAQYTLNLGSTTYADIYSPTSGNISMSGQRINLQGGQLNLKVTETPIFVLPAGSAPSSTTPGGAGAILSTAVKKVSGFENSALIATNDSIKITELTVAPNPFTQQSTVQFKIATPGYATLVVHDMQGRVVRKLFSGIVQAGQTEQVLFKAEGLSIGLYTVQLTTGAEVLHQQIVLLN